MPFGIGLDDIPGPIGDLFETDEERKRPRYSTTQPRKRKKKKTRKPPPPPKKDPTWSSRLAAGLREIREAPMGIAQLSTDVSQAGYRDIRNRLPGKDPYPYAMVRNAEGKLVVARNRQGKPIRSGGHLAESLFGLADMMATGTGLLAKDIVVGGLLDKPTLTAVGKIDKGLAARLKKAQKEAEARVSDAPLSSIGLMYGGAGALSKLVTVPQMTARMQALNPGLSAAAARTAARTELRRPGSASSLGIEGGLEPRMLRTAEGDEIRGRPWSRAAGGRTGQRVYDLATEQLDRVNPNIPFSASRRGQAVERRRQAQARKREMAELTPHMEALGDLLEGVEGVAVGARARRAAGEPRPIRERAEALIAALEGPQDATIRQSVEARIASLKTTLNRSKALEPLARQVAVLEARLKHEPDADARKEIADALRSVTAQLDLALGRRVARVSGSRERAKMARVLTQRFGRSRAKEVMVFADAMARSANPEDPGAWYRQNIADVTSEKAAAFMERTDAESRQLQTGAGYRYGLTRQPGDSVSPEKAIRQASWVNEEDPAAGIAVLRGGEVHLISQDEGGGWAVSRYDPDILGSGIGDEIAELTRDEALAYLESSERVLTDPGHDWHALAMRLENPTRTVIMPDTARTLTMRDPRRGIYSLNSNRGGLLLFRTRDGEMRAMTLDPATPGNPTTYSVGPTAVEPITGETVIPYDTATHGITPKQARAELRKADGDIVFDMDENLDRAIDHLAGTPQADEIPVFYSQLQETVDNIFSSGTRAMKAQSLKPKIRKQVSKTEWDALGMEAFFSRYHPTDRVPEAEIQEYLSSSLNAYNLDEVVYASNVSGTLGTRWGSAHRQDEGGLVAKKPTAAEPYYELVMTLPETPEGRAPFTVPVHWQDVQNPIVHIRFHIITDNEGKRAVLVDEIQSDWRSDWRTRAKMEKDSPNELDFAEARAENARRDLLAVRERQGFVALQEAQDRASEAWAVMDDAKQALRDAMQDDPSEVARLRQEYEAAAVRYRELEAEANRIETEVSGQDRSEIADLHQELGRAEYEMNYWKGILKTPQWDLGDTQVDAAVRRVMRWAHDSNIDRIIVVPGDAQVYRNMRLSRTPTGREIPELNRDNLPEWEAAWQEFNGLSHEELRTFARRNRDDKKAKAYFDLYESRYPKAFEEAIGHKGQFKEGIYNGHYTTESVRFKTEELPTGAWVIDLGAEGRRRASIPMRQMQHAPEWDGLPRGAVELLEDGRRAMRLFEEADIDTVIHELAHIALPDIDDESRLIIERHFGGKWEDWTDQQHEAYARSFEGYVRSGKAANVQLASAFSKVAQWMRQVWARLHSGEVEDFTLHPELASAYDRILGYRGTPTILSKRERSQVNDQLRSLRLALNEPLESEGYQHALEALEMLSDQIEQAGEEILTRNASSPEQAAAIREGLRRRRDLMVDHMAGQGVIDWTPESRARGYFPQTSIWDIQGMPQVSPTRMGAVSRTVGTPRLQSSAVMRKPNRLIRYSTGEVLNDPAVLVKVLRARLRFLETLKARRDLYARGKTIRSADEIPSYGVALVRNPDVAPEKIRDEINAALNLSSERYAALEMRGKMDEIDEGGDLKEAVSEFYWDPSMEGAKPAWVRDARNVRTVPLEVARVRLGDVFASNPQGRILSTLGTANALSRLAAIYLPFGGTRYVARNAAQNAVMLALTQPTALARIGRRHSKFKRDYPEEYAEILAEGGTILGTALPEFNIRATNRVQRVERTVNERTGAAGSFLGKFADNPFRWSSWTKHAERMGFDGIEGYRRLLRDPKMAEAREAVMQRVRDDMIDFDALTPFERDVISRYMYLWPFIRGITKWPFMYAREYPLRATAALQLPVGEEEEGTGTGSVRERLTMGDRDFAWLDPTGPMQENLERIERIARGKNEVKLSAVLDMAAPHWREIVQSLSDRQGQTWEKSLANTYVPFASTVNALARGGSVMDLLDRFMGQSTEPPISIVNQRKERAAEINGYLDEMESRGLSIGEDGVQQLITAHNAYERYKELSARVGFGLRDQGKDPSLGKDSKNHRLRASILLAVADEFYPGSVPLTLSDYDNLTEEGRKQFYSEVEKGLWGMRQEFLTAAKKEFG